MQLSIISPFSAHISDIQLAETVGQSEAGIDHEQRAGQA